jgi:hypothetical protein
MEVGVEAATRTWPCGKQMQYQALGPAKMPMVPPLRKICIFVPVSTNRGER